MAGSEARRAIAGGVVGLAYGFILAFLSVGAIGGGHGTGLPLLLSSAPLGVLLASAFIAPPLAGETTLFAMLYGTPLIWAALGSLVALSGGSMRHGLARALVLSQYAAGLALVLTVGRLLPTDLWSARELVALWASVYLVGQAAVWWRLGRRNPPA